MRTITFVCVAAALLSVSAFAASKPPERRPARVGENGYHNLYAESIGSAVYSPDGRTVAFVKRRAKMSLAPAAQSDFALDEVADDIWVQDGPDGAVRNLTNGASDQSGAWDPRWSPDSERMAFLSSRGGSVTLWQWERKTNQVSQISKLPIAISRHSAQDRFFTWLNARELIVLSTAGEPMLPEKVMALAARKPMQAWERAIRGEVTGSAVDSTTYRYPQMRIMVLDAATGRERLIAPTVDELADNGSNHLFYQDWWISQSAGVVALRQVQTSNYPSPIRARLGFPMDFELRRLDGSPVQLPQPLPKGIHSRSIKWTPDGKELVFFANGTAPIHPAVLFGSAAAEVMPDRKDVSGENPARLYRLNIETGLLRQVDTGEMDLGQLGAPDFECTSAGDLVFQAPRRRYGMLTSPPASRGPAWGVVDFSLPNPVIPSAPQEWWLVSREGTVRNLTDTERQALLPDDAAAAKKAFAQKIKPPVANAVMRAMAATGDSGVYSASDRFGVEKVWRVPTNGKSSLLATLNEYLGAVEHQEKSSVRYFEYTSLNGQTLWAMLELPADYRQGRRYPVIVNQYPGYMVKAPKAVGEDKDAPAPLPQMPNLAGFAMLKVSVPLNLPGMAGMQHELGAEEGDSLFMVTNGTMPAVQKLIDMGIADPDRLVATGSSHGGWGAMSLATQNTRFKTIIIGCALGGNWFSAYGGLARLFPERYLDSPGNYVLPSMPRVWGPTDIPWWRDGRATRNNPLLYVDRVQTPIMLVHGDMDTHTIDASQDFFNALVSMRKPAQFVRYWGADHDYSASPANNRDYWQRMLAWTDRWIDVARDSSGALLWDGDKVRSRSGAATLEPKDYAAFDLFGPGGEEGNKQWEARRTSKPGSADSARR